MRVNNRRGLTLIEVIAGLALAGVAFITMLMLAVQLRDARDRLLLVSRIDSNVANGDRTLRSMIRRSWIDSSANGFIGQDTWAEFATWCDVPGGWLERCRVRLHVDQANDSAFVVASTSAGETVELAAARGRLRFQYFDAAGGAGWSGAWLSHIALPAAVAIIGTRDTTIVRTGARS